MASISFFKVLVTVLAVVGSCAATRPCSEIHAGLKAPCSCDVVLPQPGDTTPGLAMDCDRVVWSSDATLPFQAPVVALRQRWAGLQALPQYALGAGQLPLRQLDLSHNLLRRLTDRLLGTLRDSLLELRLAHNLLGDGLNPVFSSGELRGLRKLLVLDLTANQLRALEQGLLDGCASLQELVLDHNALTAVPSASLNGPQALRILSLSHNRIASLLNGAFSAQPSLERLDFNFNQLTSLEGGCLEGLTRLRRLGLSHNRLSRFNSDVFQGANNLEHLDLSQNFITEVPFAALKSFNSLRHLNLSANLIKTLENSNLGSQGDLEELDLSRNSITNIASGTFRGLVKLRSLDLSVNSLRTVDEDTFQGLTSLSRLSLLDNNVLLVPASALSRLPQLSHLQMGYNRVAALSADILRPISSKVESLQLARNVVRELPVGTFKDFSRLVSLDLSGNLLNGGGLGGGTFAGLGGSLARLKLSDNRLSAVQAPLDLPSLRHLDLSRNKLSEPLPLANLSGLLHLNLSRNEQFGSVLHPGSLKGLAALQGLDLAHTGLKGVSPGLFASCPALRVVVLKGNQIQEIPESTFNNLVNLTSVDLSDNSILNIRAGAFSNLPSLRKVLLNNNRLSAFKGEFFRGGSTALLEELDLAKNELSYLFPSAFKTHPQLRRLRASDNRFTFFPAELIASLQFLETVDLSGNGLKSVEDLDFARLPRLRELLLARNEIESLSESAFHNSTQIQILDLSQNRLERLGERTFEGLTRLELLDLADNLLTELPEAIFERSRLQMLENINLARNRFETPPLRALQRQYFFLSSVDLSGNLIEEVPQEDSSLVNIKCLDLSKNPLSEAAVAAVLSEPKTVRYLNLAGIGLKKLPAGPLETPFLRSLNLSGNSLTELPSSAFERATLLEELDISDNQIASLDPGVWTRAASLRTLDVSGNVLEAVSAGDLEGLGTLRELRMSRLSRSTRVESAAFKPLTSLEVLEAYGYPRVGFMDLRAILRALPALERLDVEATENNVGGEQLGGTLHPRLTELSLRGSALRSLSGSALAGLRAPDLRVGLRNTSLTALPPALFFALPRSSKVALDVGGSALQSLGPALLAALDERRSDVALRGLASNPVRCDCGAKALRRWLGGSGGVGPGADMARDVRCAGPPRLAGKLLASVADGDLTCDPGEQTTSTTTPTPSPTPVRSTTPEPDIWTAKPPLIMAGKDATKKPAASPAPAAPVAARSNDDTLIIGIVVGVVAFIAILVAAICVVRERMAGGSQYRGGPLATGLPPPPAPPGSTCTCVKPPPPVYYTLPPKSGSRPPYPPRQAPAYFQGPAPYYVTYPAEEKDLR